MKQSLLVEPCIEVLIAKDFAPYNIMIQMH